jgi:hypothetical protein
MDDLDIGPSSSRPFVALLLARWRQYDNLSSHTRKGWQTKP